MKKNSNSQTKSGQKTKPAKARGPVERDSKEVLAELVAKLSEKLEQQPTQEKAAEARPKGVPAPNRDRLTVGVDLGDHWSNYCILGLEGETLAEAQLRTTREDVAAFFRALAAARVVIEVGTHSAWVREVVLGCVSLPSQKAVYIVRDIARYLHHPQAIRSRCDPRDVHTAR